MFKGPNSAIVRELLSTHAFTKSLLHGCMGLGYSMWCLPSRSLASEEHELTRKGKQRVLEELRGGGATLISLVSGQWRPFFRKPRLSTVGSVHRNLLSREWAVKPIRTSAMAAVSTPPCTAHPQAWPPCQLDVLRVGGSWEAQAAPGEKGLRM